MSKFFKAFEQAEPGRSLQDHVGRLGGITLKSSQRRRRPRKMSPAWGIVNASGAAICQIQPASADREEAPPAGIRSDIQNLQQKASTASMSI